MPVAHYKCDLIFNLFPQPAPEVTTPATGLNRLKNRSRLQVHKAEKPKAQAPVINRRANPLIARRNLFSSTTEGRLLISVTFTDVSNPIGLHFSPR